MATKKSTTSTKAKTKTTKTTSRKSASAKTAAAKTTKKVVKPKAAVSAKAKAPAKVTTATTAGKARRVSMQTLRRFNIFAAVLFAALAVAAGFIMSNATEQLTIGHLAKDSLASGVLAPAVHVLYDIEVRWIVVATMTLSAILPLLYLTKLESQYGQYVRNTRMVPYRWLDLGVSSALIMETIALLSGVQDIFVLKLIGGTLFVTCLLGLIAERQNNTATRPVYSAFYASLFSGFLPWLLVAAYAVGTHLWGMTSNPWYVYTLYGTTFVGFAALAFNQWKQYRGEKSWSDYSVVERNYFAINIFTKAAFAIVLIVGLRG